MCARYDIQVEGLSYQLAARAAVFRRDEGDAIDIATLQRLMRFNDWAADSVRLHVAGCRPAVKVYLAQEHFAAGTQKHLAAIGAVQGPGRHSAALPVTCAIAACSTRATARWAPSAAAAM